MAKNVGLCFLNDLVLLIIRDTGIIFVTRISLAVTKPLQHFFFSLYFFSFSFVKVSSSITTLMPAPISNCCVRVRCALCVQVLSVAFEVHYLN